MSEVKRYDCTNGKAQHCYGCYQMTESAEGDYVSSADFDAQRLRADTAEAENRILRHSNASFLETVAKVCDLLEIDLDDAKHADGQPSDVFFFHARGQADKLAAAEQRIAELSQLLFYASERLSKVRYVGLHKRIDAALNPKPEAGSHE